MKNSPIVSALRELVESDRRRGTVSLSTWLESGGDGTSFEDFKALYKSLIDDLKSVWGEPTYEGDGPAVRSSSTSGGTAIPFTYPGPKLESKIAGFSNTLELCCWLKNEKTIVLLVSSHDAGTLISLDIEMVA